MKPAWAGDPIVLSVLVPVYNERYLVEESLGRVLAFSDPRIERLEIVVVDDASTDGTREVLQGLAARHPEIELLLQPENQGKGAALRRAIAAASGDLSVVHDADLEYYPGDWSRMLDPFFEADADVVYGSRFLNTDYRRVLYFWHTLGNRLLTMLSNLATDLNLSDMETCYKMVRTKLLRSIPLRSNDFSIEPELTAKLAKRGAHIYEVPVRYSGRTYDEGKKINWRHGFGALWAIGKWRLIDDLYRQDEYGAAILNNLKRVHRFNSWMADTIRPYLGPRVLEIGAGIGNLTRRLLPRPRYVASDLNEDYLGYLNNWASGKPYLDIAKVDLTDRQDFDRLGRRFDSVICLNVLEHVEAESTALANMHSVLEPGGRAVVLVPQGPWLYGSFDRALGHVKRYRSAELRQALEQAGFEVERVFQFNKVSVPGWFVNGRILRRSRFSALQLKVLNVLLPVIRPVDRWFPWSGLSLIAVARRPPEA